MTSERPAPSKHLEANAVAYRLYCDRMAEKTYIAWDDVRACIQAYVAASTPSETASMVSVPREPTEAMLNASIAGMSFPQDFGADHQGRALAASARIYRAMLTAAPSQPDERKSES